MKLFREILVTFIFAILIFALLRLTVQSFKVQGISMLPGIQHGQYLLINKATYFFRDPQRGEVIVFHPPQQPKTDYIKRIIALPGDTVQIVGGTVFVNGTPLSEPYIKESPHYTLPPTKVPQDHYFVLGDNRNHSQDSHTGWTVPRDHIVGKAWITLWPPEQWGLVIHYPIPTTQIPQRTLLYITWQESYPLK